MNSSIGYTFTMFDNICTNKAIFVSPVHVQGTHGVLTNVF